MENYHVLQQVGEGSFGKVYKGRRKYCGQVVALKFIPKGGRSQKELKVLRQEIEILRTLQHENIVLMLDYFETADQMCVVTEFAQGELFDILEDDRSLVSASHFGHRQLLCALAHLCLHIRPLGSRRTWCTQSRGSSCRRCTTCIRTACYIET